jgi:hypothetical protein
MLPILLDSLIDQGSAGDLFLIHLHSPCISESKAFCPIFFVGIPFGIALKGVPLYFNHSCSLQANLSLIRRRQGRYCLETTESPIPKRIIVHWMIGNLKSNAKGLNVVFWSLFFENLSVSGLPNQTTPFQSRLKFGSTCNCPWKLAYFGQIVFSFKKRATLFRFYFKCLKIGIIFNGNVG